jgi:hypothetical protein
MFYWHIWSKNIVLGYDSSFGRLSERFDQMGDCVEGFDDGCAVSSLISCHVDYAEGSRDGFDVPVDRDEGIGVGSDDGSMVR